MLAVSDLEKLPLAIPVHLVGESHTGVRVPSPKHIADPVGLAGAQWGHWLALGRVSGLGGPEAGTEASGQPAPVAVGAPPQVVMQGVVETAAR